MGCGWRGKWGLGEQGIHHGRLVQDFKQGTKLQEQGWQQGHMQQRGHSDKDWALGGPCQAMVSIIFFSLLDSNYHTCVFLPVSLSKPFFATPFLSLLPDILSCLYIPFQEFPFPHILALKIPISNLLALSFWQWKVSRVQRGEFMASQKGSLLLGEHPPLLAGWLLLLDIWFPSPSGQRWRRTNFLTTPRFPPGAWGGGARLRHCYVKRVRAEIGGCWNTGRLTEWVNISRILGARFPAVRELRNMGSGNKPRGVGLEMEV